MRFIFYFALMILFGCKNYKNEKEEIATNSHYDKAFVFLENNQLDSSFYYFNSALKSFELENNINGLGKCYMNSGIIQLKQGDYFGSEESLVYALRFLKEPTDNDYLISVYNSIAVSRKNLKDYKSSLMWYEKAIKISKDSLETIKIQNNIAVAYSKLGNYNKSIHIFKGISNSKIVNHNQIFKYKLIDNLAFTKFLQNKNYNAEPELNKALKIRENEKDLWGQNASHAHLSDYYEEKNIEKSLFHAHKMYEIATELKSPDDKIEALQKLINLENLSNSKKYFNIYRNLNDSLQTARNKAKNQFALIRYETEKNRADLLKSRAENTEKNYQLLLRNILIGLAVLAFIIILIWIEKRRKRVLQEKRLIIQENELKIKSTALEYSKKVHDVVSNGVYQIMSEIENTDEIDKNKILNKLENIYEKSRDISYDNVSENSLVSYKTKISQLVNSFNSESLKCIIVGNEENLWKQVSSNIKSELLVILQELLVNFKKHSKAKKLKLEFEKIGNQLNITYTDDGIGFDENFEKKNGLQNTESRIFSCKGCINFEQTTEKGTTINISFPLNKL